MPVVSYKLGVFSAMQTEGMAQVRADAIPMKFNAHCSLTALAQNRRQNQIPR